VETLLDGAARDTEAADPDASCAIPEWAKTNKQAMI
jgi:hypothetical protein